MKTIRNQKGLAPLIIIILVALAIGAVGYAGYAAYQARQDKAATETASDSPTTTKNGESVTPDPNEGFFVVKEMGVRLPITTTTDDLVYYYEARDGEEYAYFSSKSLAAAGSKTTTGANYCNAKDGPAGAITKTPEQMFETDIKIGSFYFRYTSPQATCSDVQAAVTIQNGLMSELKEAFESIEASK